MSLTREQLLAPRPLPREEVSLPEFGDSVFVRVMTGMERDAWEASMYNDREHSLENARARLLVRCLCGPDSDTPLLQPEDADALGRQHSGALERATRVAQRLNRLNDKAIEETKGNSQPTPGDAQS